MSLLKVSIPPGEILCEEFMAPLGITQDELAKRIGVSRRRINEIVRGKRSITADTAKRLSRAFGNSAEFWLNLQIHHDLTQTAEPKGIRRFRRKPKNLDAA